MNHLDPVMKATATAGAITMVMMTIITMDPVIITVTKTMTTITATRTVIQMTTMGRITMEWIGKSQRKRRSRRGWFEEPAV